MLYTLAYKRYTYSRSPLISLMRDRMMLQLQLTTPGSGSMTSRMSVSISSLEVATAKKLAEKPDRTPEEDDLLDLLTKGGSRVSMCRLEGPVRWYLEEQHET